MNKFKLSAVVTKVAKTVKASLMGGWFPKNAFDPAPVEWLSGEVKDKLDRTTNTYSKNVVVKFKAAGIICYTYLSALEGLWQGLRDNGEVEGDFLTYEVNDNGEEVALFPDDIRIGYEDQNDAVFTKRMVMAKK